MNERKTYKFWVNGKYHGFKSFKVYWALRMYMRDLVDSELNGISSFESRLLKLGYIRHSFNYKTKQLEISKRYLLSTMGDIYYVYIKDEIQIYWGLHEYDKPPTLIYPRPKDIREHQHGGDDMMNRMLLNESFENIYAEIIKPENNS